MTQDEIIELAKQAGLYVAHDSEGHFSGVTNEEIIDMYPDPDKERDRLFRESIFIEVLMPFAKLVAAKEHAVCLEIANYCADADMHASFAANAIRARSTSRGEA